MASFPVKWFDSRFHGIPTLNGTPGSMVALLDACLINGFGQTNIITITVLNKKATIVIQDGVQFFRKSVVAIAGFSNSALNTEYRVTKSEIGKLEIELDAPDGPLAITAGTVKYAPIGWFKPYSSVNQAIYKPSKVDAKQWMFYMNDSTAMYSEIKLIENAANIEVHTGSRPHDKLLRWNKSYVANTATNAFSIVGDPYSFYYKTSGLSSSIANDRNYGIFQFVGEGVPLTNNSDLYSVYLGGLHPKNAIATNASNIFSPDYAASSRNLYCLRGVNGLKAEVEVRTNFKNVLPWNYFNTGANSDIFFTDDNIVHLYIDNFFESPDRRITKIPGIVTASATPLKYDHFDYILEAKDNTLNKDLILCKSTTGLSANNAPNVFFYMDITGPWR